MHPSVINPVSEFLFFHRCKFSAKKQGRLTEVKERQVYPVLLPVNAMFSPVSGSTKIRQELKSIGLLYCI
jgi:hypothetical protein